MVGHKTKLNKCEKIEIISRTFLDHNGLKLETNFKKNTQKHSYTWKLNKRFLNNEWISNEINKEIKNYLKTNENEYTMTQNLWDTVKAVLGGKFIAIQAYIKKIEKPQVNNLTLHLKTETRGTATNKAQSMQKEGNMIKLHRDKNNNNNSKDQWIQELDL